MKKSTVLIGKGARAVARIKGGGSALPGLITEKIDPGFLANVLSDLPLGMVVVSGTNGKTTTTKMVVELLESYGLKVFTNRTGSNFTRGVVSSLLGEIRNFKLNADIAVLELDEAHAVQFVHQVKPTYALLLNVLRDQLDRFSEIDKTAKLLSEIARNTTGGIVLNRDDPRIAALAENADIPVKYFGYKSNLADKFPNDDELHTKKSTKIASKSKTDVELTDFSNRQATYDIDGKSFTTPLLLRGAHNTLNAAAALAITRMVLGKKVNNEKLMSALSQVKPAFGRGESVVINGQELEMILVKNPAGFRIAIAGQYDPNMAVMISINDHFADGRDVSWLYDVDFTAMKEVSVVSGIRAYDMALRLQYDDIKVGLIEPDLRKALSKFLSDNSDKPKQIYCTYTTMLKLRKLIGAIVKIEDAL